MRMNTFENVSLAELLASYMDCAHAFVRSPDQVRCDRLDACFRELRAAQQLNWPQGKDVVDALGLAGCDLVNAPQLRAGQLAHDRAVAIVLERLAPAAEAA